MTALTISLILIMLLLAAGLGAFFALIKRPPVVHFDVGDVRIDMVGTLDAGQVFPATMTLRLQHQPVPMHPADDLTRSDEPLPLDVIEYIDRESDDWARTARRAHARRLRETNGRWEGVLDVLKKEDGIEDQPQPE